MALALRMGIEEMVPAAEALFLALIRELPDDCIIADGTYSGFDMGTEEGVRYYGPDWDVLVFGPGILVALGQTDWAALVSLEDKGEGYVFTYLDYEGSQHVWDSSTWKSLFSQVADSREVEVGTEGEEDGGDEAHSGRAASSSTQFGLQEIAQLISKADELFPPDVCRFFENLRAVEATVLPFARHEWDPAIGERLGYGRLFTLDQILVWLREMSDSAAFSERHWDEARVRAFIETIGADYSARREMAWKSMWEDVEKQLRLHSLAQKDIGPISDEALREEVSGAFPFPLAFSLRRALTPHDPSIDYSEKLRCAENFLAYLGSLGIALAQAAGLGLKPGQDLNVDLAGCWSRGMSAGHWVGIIRETTRAFHILNDPERLVVPELPAIWWREDRRKPRPGGLSEIFNTLVEHRNRFHHGRGSMTSKEMEKAAEDLQQTLLGIVRDLRFLCHYPLWYVMDCAAQRGSSLLKISYKLCMGDHPEFEHREADHDEFLIRDSLYLRSDAQLLDLTPWLTARTCPQCGHEAMFFVEEIDRKKGVVTFKSFERGHTDESEDHWDEIARLLGL